MTIKQDGKIIEYKGRYDIVSYLVCDEPVEYIASYQIGALITALKEAKKHAEKDDEGFKIIRLYKGKTHTDDKSLFLHKPFGERHKAIAIASIREEPPVLEMCDYV